MGINTTTQVGMNLTVPRTRSLSISLYPPPMAFEDPVVRLCYYRIFIPMTSIPVLGGYLVYLEV